MTTVDILPQNSQTCLSRHFPSQRAGHESVSGPLGLQAVRDHLTPGSVPWKSSGLSQECTYNRKVSKTFRFNSLHSIVLPNSCRIIDIHKPWCKSLSNKSSERSVSISSTNTITYKNGPFCGIKPQTMPCPHFGSGIVHFLLESETDLAYNRPRIESTVAGKGSFRINKFNAQGSVSFWALLHLSS
jgi:hypothetical protein